jgi:hypothetical protein
MRSGRIYVFYNRAMPGLVKIGRTTRTAEERAREISAGTGVPADFEVAWEEEFSDCEMAERIIHERLNKHRPNQGREFFRIQLQDAIREVQKHAMECHELERKRAAELMQPGLIYVLLNPCYKGWVKIGRTTRTAEERAREISSSAGVPAPFVVAFDREFSDCEKAERTIHELLAKHRTNRDREFFRIEVKDAIRAVMALENECPESEHAGELVAARSEAAPKEAEPTKRPAVNGFPAWRIFRPSPSSVRIPGVLVATVSCSSCSTDFSVTLKRGEQQAVCPSCRAVSTMSILW